jgi:FkbM family methyltransferase
MFNSHIRKLLKQCGILERLKASFLRDLYWMMTNRDALAAREEELDFYRNLLCGFRKGDLIFDIGANVGKKTDIFLRLGARVVAVEPDEQCQSVLKEKFLKFRLAARPLVIIGKAISDKQTRETMWVDGPGSALNTLNTKWVEVLRADKTRFENTGDSLTFAQQKDVETLTLEQLFSGEGVPFFVKVDVEGYERSVLRGLKRPIPFLSFEVNLPQFLPEAKECVHLLAELDAQGKFNFAADCRRGLLLDHWMGPHDFLQVLNTVTQESIEVFWKTTP